MDSTLETPRLRLIRLTDTSDNSQHLQWFHQLWNDDATTAWRCAATPFYLIPSILTHALTVSTANATPSSKASNG